MSKAILVVDITDDYVGSIIEVKIYSKNNITHETYKNKLKPLPKQTICYPANQEPYWDGWNDCLDEILGEE